MPVDFKLYLITDRFQTRGRALAAVVEEALQGGVGAVQLREKDLPAGDFLRLAIEMRRITSQYSVRLLINGRANVARDVDADGVHLPESGLAVETARSILGPNRLIGGSCHSLDAAKSAQDSGADFITFGPIFQTSSKAHYGAPLGLERLAEAASTLKIPVFGLGGIKESNIDQVMAAGAYGIALVSAILTAEQPRTAAASITKTMQSKNFPELDKRLNAGQRVLRRTGMRIRF